MQLNRILTKLCFLLATVLVTSHQVIWFGPRWKATPGGLAWFTTTLLMEHSSVRKGSLPGFMYNFLMTAQQGAGLAEGF